MHFTLIFVNFAPNLVYLCDPFAQAQKDVNSYKYFKNL